MRTRCGTRVGPPRRAPSRSPSPSKKAVSPAPPPPAPRKPKRCPKCNKKMVFTAIMHLRNRNGTSARKITKFVAQEYNVAPSQVRRVIKRQIANGRLMQTRSMGGGMLVLQAKQKKVVIKPKKVVCNPMKTRSGKMLAAQKVVKKAKKIVTTSKVTVKVCMPAKQLRSPFTRSCKKIN